MTDNGKPILDILKVELIDKKLHVTFNKDVPNTLIYDRALTLARLQLENMIIGSQVEQEQEEQSKIIKAGDIFNRLKRK